MSLRQIAKQLGISPAYLSYMVNGKWPWREDLYERYCHFVNTTVHNMDVGVNNPPKGGSGVVTSVAIRVVGDPPGT